MPGSSVKPSTRRNRLKQMVGQPNAGPPRISEALTKELLDTTESMRQTAITHGQLIQGLVNW